MDKKQRAWLQTKQKVLKQAKPTKQQTWLGFHAKAFNLPFSRLKGLLSPFPSMRSFFSPPRLRGCLFFPFLLLFAHARAWPSGYGSTRLTRRVQRSGYLSGFSIFLKRIQVASLDYQRPFQITAVSKGGDEEIMGAPQGWEETSLLHPDQEGGWHGFHYALPPCLRGQVQAGGDKKDQLTIKGRESFCNGGAIKFFIKTLPGNASPKEEEEARFSISSRGRVSMMNLTRPPETVKRRSVRGFRQVRDKY